jgi:hypothetical protein
MNRNGKGRAVARTAFKRTFDTSIVPPERGAVKEHGDEFAFVRAEAFGEEAAAEHVQGVAAGGLQMALKALYEIGTEGDLVAAGLAVYCIVRSIKSRMIPSEGVGVSRAGAGSPA